MDTVRKTIEDPPPNDAYSAPGVATPELRAVQHRVRNDLQTLGALWRLARRRADADVLVDEFALWLNALAAVYDSVPLWQANERVSAHELITALRTRCDFGARFEFCMTTDPCLPAQMAVVTALALAGILGYCAEAAQSDTPIKVSVTHSTGITRVEAIYAQGSQTPAWPPLSLTVAGEAAGVQYAVGPDGDEMVAVLVMTCH